MKKCPYCKQDKPEAEVKRQSFDVISGNLGRVTSEIEMCNECLSKAKRMVA